MNGGKSLAPCAFVIILTENPGVATMTNAVLVKGRDIDGREKTLTKSQPYQLDLFQQILPDEDRYSNTIELYDALPRFFPSPKKMAELREGGKFLNTLVREFYHRNAAYRLEIRPGRIRTKQGSDLEYYPSEREQLVEEALWKIAHDKMRGCFLDQMVGVEFTLYELRKELERQGHAIKFSALIDALTILNRCNISLHNESGRAVFSSAIFPELLIASRSDWLENPKQAKCYVQFNKLATHNLRHIEYRLFDYKQFMDINLMLGRWFFKRLSHNFTQAKWLGTKYEIRASTIIRDSGLLNSISLRQNFQTIEESLKELKAKRVLDLYKKTNVRASHDNRKIADVVYEIHPSRQFCDTAILANQRRHLLAEIADKDGKLLQIREEDKVVMEVQG
jgi:hypothetical protein